MFGRNRKLRQEIERKNVQLESQQKRIAFLEIKLLKTEEALERAKGMIDAPPVFKKGQQIGSVTILEVFVADDRAHFGKIVAEAGLLLLGMVAMDVALSRAFPNTRPPDAAVNWNYRFYDDQTRSVKEMTEEEMKDLIKNRG
jgi:hypothetical protein